MSLMFKMLGLSLGFIVTFICRVSSSSSWINVLGCKGPLSSDSLSHRDPFGVKGL